MILHLAFHQMTWMGYLTLMVSIHLTWMDLKVLPVEYYFHLTLEVYLAWSAKCDHHPALEDCLVSLVDYDYHPG